MQLLKKLLDFYINSSIHVALAVFALVKLTQFMFPIMDDEATVYFAFFGTIVGYNFVKYDALARAQKKQMRSQLKAIAVLSFVALLATGYYFFQLRSTTQIIGVAFLILTLLYTLPFFPNKKNARNWVGIKIYIVALCWVGVTLFLPIINAELPLTNAVFLVALQRFILVFVLILIFEIIDLQNDDPHLQTVPQQIGVKRTKIVGSLLLFIFISLEFLNPTFSFQNLLLKVGIAITVLLFLLFSNEKRSKYYTSFWVESVPIFWWILVMISSCL
ncbi:MAG: hypothetical protein V4648_01520 [Bacteroidota bacterium]